MHSPTRIIPDIEQANRSRSIRRAAVAGQFYPAQPAKLAASLRAYLDHARTPPAADWRAMIAPHAGYACSGATAAQSFKALAAHPTADYTVFLLGPAHWLPVEGVGLSSARAFETPLGQVAVAADSVDALLTRHRHYTLADAAHTPEHSIEVELPFLQTVLEAFTIVPMLLGATTDPARVAEDLMQLSAALPNTLIVVSSDLSHYHRYRDAIRMDQAFLQAVADGDIHAASRGEACGLPGILALMHVARRLGWRPSLLAYANSGDTCGAQDAVVGYGAVAYAGPMP